jgi:hypothetical protein
MTDLRWIAICIAGAMLINALAIIVVRAGERTLKNDRGQETGRATTRGDTTTVEDSFGREIGRTERRSDGSIDVIDNMGRRMGTIREKTKPQEKQR